MKKTFGFIVTFCMLFFLALTNVSNAEVITFSGTVTQKLYSDITNESFVTFTVDTSTNKATVTFKRGYVGWNKPTVYSDGHISDNDKEAISEGFVSSHERYYHNDEPERWNSLQELIATIKSLPSSGSATCDVKPGKYYKYEFINFKFNGEKYPLVYSNGPMYMEHVKIVNYTTIGIANTVHCVFADGTDKSYYDATQNLVITENVEAPVVEEKKHFTIKKDNFGFVNTQTAFIKNTNYSGQKSLQKMESYPEGTYGYLLSDTLYNALTENMNSNNLMYFHEFLSSKFIGACHGMSNLAAQIYLGKFKVSEFSSSATKTYDIEKPVNNKKLAQTLVYYQLAQYMNLYTENIAIHSGTEEDDAETVIKTLKSKGEECLAVVGAYVEGGSHAVLAYKFTENNNGYVIECYDPNYPTEAEIITVSKDFSTTTNSKHSKFILKGVNDPYLLNETAVKQNLKNMSAPEGTIVKTPAENITIKSKEGEVQIKDGEVKKNTADADIYHPLDGDVIVEYHWGVPEVEIIADGPVTYGGEEWIVFEQQWPGPIVDGDEWIINIDDEGIDVRSQNGEEEEISIEYSSSRRKNSITKVSAKAGRLKVKDNGTTATVVTDNGSKVDVEVGDLKQTKFKAEDVDTSKKTEVVINDEKVEVKENGQVVKTITENGNQQVQPGTIDVALIVNKAKEKAKDFSQRVIERIKAKTDTVNKFKNKGYRHSSWAEEEVARADELGIIPYSIINKLQNNITRKEFCEIAYQTVKSLTGMSDSEMKAFCSTPDSSNPYAYQYSDTAISFAYGTGIVNGYPDGSFGPNDLITRAQAAKMLVVTAEIMGKMTSESGAKRFNDNPNDWSQTYINKISSIISPYTASRVMGGDDKGNFMPLANYTCEQAVLTMERLIENVIGENANYNEGTVKAEEVKPQTITSNDNDQTYYTMKNWSWTREGSEGYGRPYFTSGKYVREDGRAVIYLDSSDSTDFFSYILYALPEGAKQSAYTSYVSSGSYSCAETTSNTKAYDIMSGIYFTDNGNHVLDVTSDWMDDLYIYYGSVDGRYKLVREK